MGSLKICAVEVDENLEMIPGKYKVCPIKGCFSDGHNQSSTQTPLLNTTIIINSPESSTAQSTTGNNQQSSTTEIDHSTTSLGGKSTTEPLGTVENVFFISNILRSG